MIMSFHISVVQYFRPMYSPTICHTVKCPLAVSYLVNIKSMNRA